MTYIMKDNKKFGINSNKAEEIIYNDISVKDALDKLDFSVSEVSTKLSYGIATSQNGTTKFTCQPNTAYTWVISFDEPFNTIPTVVASCVNNNNYQPTLTITEVTKGGFTCSTTSTLGSASSVTITWNATGDVYGDAVSLTGSWTTKEMNYNSVDTIIVTFEKPFITTPTVTIAVDAEVNPGCYSVTVSDITQTSFKITAKDTVDATFSLTVNWSATAAAFTS